MEPLLDVEGAAAFLSVSPWTVRAYIRDGRLQPIRLGRLVRLDAAEIQSFIEAAKLNRSSKQNLNREGEEQ
jgi:excisionase family DNA binding protein